MKIDIVYGIVILIIIVLLLYAYLSSDYYYTHVVLKNAFEKLNGPEIKRVNPDMNWKVVNMNIDGYINNKKIVFNQPVIENPKSFTFTNKNALAAFMNNVLVVDIDSNEDNKDEDDDEDDEEECSGVDAFDLFGCFCGCCCC